MADFGEPIPLGIHVSWLTGEEFDAERRESRYREEIVEIARLRESLKLDSLAGHRMTEDAKRRGNQILDARLRLAEARHKVDPIPEYVPPEEIEPKKPTRGRGNWRGRVTPRKTARAAGKTHYISNKLCLWNHNSRRYVSTGQCVACMYLRGEALAAAKERAKLVANRSQD